MLFLPQIICYVDNILWNYIGVILIVSIGSYFTWLFKFGQLTKFYSICQDFFISCIKINNKNKNGIHPIKVFFTSIGGCIGIGNVVAACTAIKIGGPGALFWIWVAAFFGMVFKYAEVYLGMLYRIKNANGSFYGGPMYFLQKVFKGPIIPIISSLLLAIYATEIYIFNTLNKILINSCNCHKVTTTAILIIAVVSVGLSGINRVGTICSAIIPLFLIVFVGMCSWILFKNAENIPKIISIVFSSAFSGHAQLGGFAGSSMMMAMSNGTARACYSGDIGVGFASVIHSESSSSNCKKQSSLAILGIFLDTFMVCTMSILVILCTDIWSSDISTSKMVHEALSTEFSNTSFFMPMFIILLGYSSMISFYCVGEKCLKFVFPKHGSTIYFIYTIICLSLFSTAKSSTTLSIMSTVGLLLLIINSIGIFYLRKKIKFI